MEQVVTFEDKDLAKSSAEDQVTYINNSFYGKHI